jgi:hypothetical protein
LLGGEAAELAQVTGSVRFFQRFINDQATARAPHALHGQDDFAVVHLLVSSFSVAT